MDELVTARLVELRQEYQKGEERLRELLQHEAALRETLLRISGAIQVLEELSKTDAESGRSSAEVELPRPTRADALATG